MCEQILSTEHASLSVAHAARAHVTHTTNIIELDEVTPFDGPAKSLLGFGFCIVAIEAEPFKICHMAIPTVAINVVELGAPWPRYIPKYPACHLHPSIHV